jgi:hypothetical protein
VSFRPVPVATLAWWGVVAVLGITAVAHWPAQARHLRSDVQVGRQSSTIYHELQPARTVGLSDPRLFLTAERLLPKDATFAVVTGPNATIKDPLVLLWIRRFARYRLLPRRLVHSPRQADWVLNYGGRLPAGVLASKVIRISPGVSVIEVERP